MMASRGRRPSFRGPRGPIGLGKPENATNPMAGSGMQQARSRPNGANRRGGAKPRGRNGISGLAAWDRWQRRSRRCREWTFDRSKTAEGRCESQERQERGALRREAPPRHERVEGDAKVRRAASGPTSERPGCSTCDVLEGPGRRRPKTRRARERLTTREHVGRVDDRACNDSNAPATLKTRPTPRTLTLHRRESCSRFNL